MGLATAAAAGNVWLLMSFQFNGGPEPERRETT